MLPDLTEDDPAAREAALVARWSLIPDLTERFALATQAHAGPGLPPECRTDDTLVPGCVSRVWLVASRDANGRLALGWDAESAIVRGLAGIVCAVHAGTVPAAAAAHETAILSGLGFDRMLSPTRLHGMTALAARLRVLAAALA